MAPSLTILVRPPGHKTMPGTGYLVFKVFLLAARRMYNMYVRSMSAAGSFRRYPICEYKKKPDPLSIHNTCACTCTNV